MASRPILWAPIPPQCREDSRGIPYKPCILMSSWWYPEITSQPQKINGSNPAPPTTNWKFGPFFSLCFFSTPSWWFHTRKPWASRTGKGFNGLETSAKCKKSSIHCREFFCITWPPNPHQILPTKNHPPLGDQPNDLHTLQHEAPINLLLKHTVTSHPQRKQQSWYLDTAGNQGWDFDVTQTWTQNETWRAWKTAVACLLQSTFTLLWTEPASSHFDLCPPSLKVPFPHPRSPPLRYTAVGGQDDSLVTRRDPRPSHRSERCGKGNGDVT